MFNSLLISVLVGVSQASQVALPTLRLPYPGHSVSITSGTLGRDSVVAIVRPLAHESSQERIVLSGRLPTRWQVETVEVVATSDSTLPRTLRVLTPADDPAPTVEEALRGRQKPMLLGGKLTTGHTLPPLRPDPGATFLLAANRARGGRLRLDDPWAHLRAPYMLKGELRADSPDEVAGCLLVRCGARKVDADPDGRHAFLKTLVKGLAGADEECVWQAAEAVRRSSGLQSDSEWIGWFHAELQPLIHQEAERRGGFARLCLESAWQTFQDMTPWSSPPIVEAINDFVATGRPLGAEEEDLLRKITVGRFGATFARTIAIARRTPQDWLRLELIDALPEPRNEGEYRLALAMGGDSSDRVVGILASRLAEWGGRPDLRPVSVGTSRNPSGAELRALIAEWNKVRFEELKRSETVIPRRASR